MKPVRLARDIVVDAAMGWFNDEAMSRGAAIAFYTIFSLVPCVILVTTVAGLFIGRDVAQGAMMDEVAKMIGRDAATTLQTLAAGADDTETGSMAGMLGVATILVGATTVFAELQASLNRIWKAEPPANSTITWLVKVRLRGLALIGAVGFILIVSLVVSAVLAVFGTWLAKHLPDVTALIWITNLTGSLIVFTVLFALVYRALPDTVIPWIDLWLGAGMTAVLFTIGKSLIGLYLGTSGIALAYGAAGSFVIILVWVYYSATIFLFGAEVTRAYSEHVGSRATARGP